MRVITGTARGLRLEALEGMDVRPTSDMVKEAAFSMIQFEIEGRNVLDIFAGSGQLGIETLSRGAKSATFVDANPEAVKVVKANLAHTDLSQQASVAVGDFEQFLKHTKSVFDIVFVDPPYSKGLVEAALPLLTPHMSENGIIVCEIARNDALPEQSGEFVLTRRGNYGKTSLALYRKNTSTAD
jgi:16S rRNA (guanine(966)-N(2))-methyltransferase RsmD